MTLQWTAKSLPLSFLLDVVENNREFQSDLDLTFLGESAEIKFGGRAEHGSKYRVKRFYPGRRDMGILNTPLILLSGAPISIVPSRPLLL